MRVPDDPFEGLPVETEPMWPGLVILGVVAALILLVVLLA